MKTKISVSVIMDSVKPDESRVIVRKVTLMDDDKFVAKYGLTSDGTWLIVPEGERYPDQCLLPVIIIPKPYPNPDFP